MESLSIRMPDELKRKVDEARAEEAVEGGEIQNRSEWIREAIREKLGIEYEAEGEEVEA